MGRYCVDLVLTQAVAVLCTGLSLIAGRTLCMFDCVDAAAIRCSMTGVSIIPELGSSLLYKM